MEHTGKIVLVTGANKGIGYEICRQLGAAGMTVVIGARNTDAGEEAVRTLTQNGVVASVVSLDVTDPTSIAAAKDAIEERYGKLDILVNNAGIASMAVGKPSETDVDAARQIFETNFFGPIAVTKAMLPLLRKAGGTARIINQSSDLGSLNRQSDGLWHHAQVKPVGYSASKAALNMLTVQLSWELQAEGIAVSSANPGSTATDLNNNFGQQTVAEGAAPAVRLALMEVMPSGIFLGRDGQEPW